MDIKNIQTIDVIAKEYYDKTNGNSYFAARVTINFCLPGEKMLFVPFQYGYGSAYESAAVQALIDSGIKINPNMPLWRVGRDAEPKIITRTIKIERCPKRDVLAWGKEHA